MELKEIKQASYEIYKLIKSTEDTEAKKALRYAFNLIEYEIPRNPYKVLERTCTKPCVWWRSERPFKVSKLAMKN